MRHLLSNSGSTVILLAAILLGSLIGHYAPAPASVMNSYVDPLILALVSLLFFEISFQKISFTRQNLNFLTIAWVANFLFIPLIGWGIASLFLSGKPLIYTGLIIYLIAPCTDWFLGFTRLAKGNVILGSVLIPINLISQLILFPIYLTFFVGEKSGVDASAIATTIWTWFLIPFVSGILLHQVFKRTLPTAFFEKILSFVNSLIPFVIGALVACIFAGNMTTILENIPALLIILQAVFFFFIVTYLLSEFLSRRFQLAYPERALLTMTTSARNAPLMLGLATAAFPDQPLIYAALIIGMLIEFPHLAALKHLLLRQNNLSSAQTNPNSASSEPNNDAAIPSA